jgi:RimJ/RimL family protein N-acetyltransferase
MDGLVGNARKAGRKHRAAAPSVALVSVYRLPKAAPELLYRLLEERGPHVNISHRGMPTWKNHLRFIAGHPYSAWYLVRSGQDYVGAIYLTALGEIGIGVLAQWRGHGFGRAAIRALMRKHPRSRFLANINPSNATSIRMFSEMGFQIIQQTYELRSK